MMPADRTPYWLAAADSLLNASYVVLDCGNVIAVAYSVISDPFVDS